MAYFHRMVNAGAVSDPRSWTYAVYKCNVCHQESEHRVPDIRVFQTRERLCPKCGCMDSQDRFKALETRRQDILKKITSLNAELLDVETELSQSGLLNQTEKTPGVL